VSKVSEDPLAIRFGQICARFEEDDVQDQR
jgi:hypothetical protein